MSLCWNIQSGSVSSWPFVKKQIGNMNRGILTLGCVLAIAVAQPPFPRPNRRPGLLGGLNVDPSKLPEGVDADNTQSILAFVRLVLSKHITNLSELCPGDSPIPDTCKCAAGEQDSIDLSTLNLADGPNPDLALTLWDCKPSECTCSNGDMVEVERPNIDPDILPRRAIERIINIAFG